MAAKRLNQGLGALMWPSQLCGAQLFYQLSAYLSRTGNPYDNAKAERLMRTLKYEEIYMNDYETLTEVRVSIEHFIEAVYNRKRLH